MEVGQYYVLKAYRLVAQGMYLKNDQGEEILLPSKYVPAELQEGDTLRVFVWIDSQNRLVATTQQPKVELNGFAILKCVSIAPFGAFMDWGLDRDLLVPNAEMVEGMRPGSSYLTYMYIDDQDRLTGTTLIDRCTEYEDIELSIGEEVELLIYSLSDFGAQVIINQTYAGLVYQDDIYRPLRIGEVTKGYIRRIRADKKIDVTLRRFGYSKVIDDTERILALLRLSGGFLPLNDKSDPADIKRHLEMSKKVFKKAVGGLYKKKRIALEPHGIRLIEKTIL